MLTLTLRYDKQEKNGSEKLIEKLVCISLVFPLVEENVILSQCFEVTISMPDWGTGRAALVWLVRALSSRRGALRVSSMEYSSPDPMVLFGLISPLQQHSPHSFTGTSLNAIVCMCFSAQEPSASGPGGPDAGEGLSDGFWNRGVGLVQYTSSSSSHTSVAELQGTSTRDEHNSRGVSNVEVSVDLSCPGYQSAPPPHAHFASAPSNWS